MDKPDTQELPVSKTALKKQMLGLQKLGEELISLSPGQLQKIPLPDNLSVAIHDAKKMTKRRALYRQRQFIGKLMRTIDAAPIQAALDELRHPERQGVARFHRVEAWREQLIASQGAKATEFIEEFAAVDRQQFSQKIRAACQERKTGKPVGAERALFRFIDKELAKAADVDN